MRKKLEPTALILVGIGGSNLGTIAIHEALHGRFYNEKNPPIKLYCADTVDSDALSDQLALVEFELKKGNNIIINVVTKSGKTTETIANFELFLSLLKKYKPDDFYQCVVVTTDQDSPFAYYARKEFFSVLEIPKKVGGRYSVFTAVGLFPLGMLDVDIAQLLAGAQAIMPSCIDENVVENPAAISALIKYIHYQQCININDLFIFYTSLNNVGLWYRQLMGESIGKEFNRSNQRVEVGITPTVSIGTTDLHSVGQLYLGGPRDKFTTFLVVDQFATDLTIPVMPVFEEFVEKIQGKKLSVVLDAVLKGVQAAFKTNKRPFVTVHLPFVNEHMLGQLLQMYMIEMIYLGYLLEVNPFDQPNVESYKKETRKILAHE